MACFLSQSDTGQEARRAAPSVCSVLAQHQAQSKSTETRPAGWVNPPRQSTSKWFIKMNTLFFLLHYSFQTHLCGHMCVDSFLHSKSLFGMGPARFDCLHLGTKPPNLCGATNFPPMVNVGSLDLLLPFGSRGWSVAWAQPVRALCPLASVEFREGHRPQAGPWDLGFCSHDLK